VTCKKIPPSSILFLVASILCLLCLSTYVSEQRNPRFQTVQTSFFQMSIPSRCRMQPVSTEDSPEITLWNGKTQVGGLVSHTHPDTAELVKKIQHPDGYDMWSIVLDLGLFPSNDTPVSYIMDSGPRGNFSFDIWEERNGSERDHFYFLADPDTLYDLWFYCDAFGQNARFVIANSFAVH